MSNEETPQKVYANWKGLRKSKAENILEEDWHLFLYFNSIKLTKLIIN